MAENTGRVETGISPEYADGFTDDGMPVGLQLIGQPRGEAGLLQVARAIEIVVGGPFGPIDPLAPE